MSPTHALADRDQLTAADLDGEDFISFDDDLPIAKQIARYLKSADVQ